MKQISKNNQNLKKINKIKIPKDPPNKNPRKIQNGCANKRDRLRCYLNVKSHVIFRINLDIKNISSRSVISGNILTRLDIELFDHCFLVLGSLSVRVWDKIHNYGQVVSSFLINFLEIFFWAFLEKLISSF